MPPYSTGDRVKEHTLRLRNGRVICAILRKRGLLGENPHRVARLANDLLRSMVYLRQK